MDTNESSKALFLPFLPSFFVSNENRQKDAWEGHMKGVNPLAPASGLMELHMKRSTVVLVSCA